MRRPTFNEAVLIQALVWTVVHANTTYSQEVVPDDLSPVPSEVDEITVTGTASSVTNVQDEAQAVTAFGMDDLDRANIVNVDGLAYNVPGLHVGQQGQQAIVTLRGIGTENATITGEPGVAFHVDGINYARPAAARVSFFDLEGIQVLRGPQGTKGGKNTTAGAINVVSRKPTDDFETSGDVLFGNYNRVMSRGAVNVPLGEYAATRFAFIVENRDGYLENLTFNDNDRDAFDVDSYGFRTHFRLNPTESLELLGTYHYFGEKGNGPQEDLVPLDTTCPALSFPGIPPRASFKSTLPRLAICLGPGQETAIAETDPRAIYTNAPTGQDNRYWGWTAAATWDVPDLDRLGPTQLKLLGGFQATDIDFQRDFDATSLFIVDVGNLNESEQYSAELQWSSLGSELVDWQFSAFYMREESEANVQVAVSTGLGLLVEQETENSAYGAALHTDWYLSDAHTLSLGGRYTKDKKRSNLFRNNGVVATFGGLLVGCTGVLDSLSGGIPKDNPPWCSQIDRHFTGGAALEWRATDFSLLYARVDRGFKSGGFNVGGFGEFDPEYVWSYAIGSKNTFFDERVTLNLEGFFYDYSDLQLLLLDGLKFRIENADAEIYGGELEIKASPVDGLRLSGIVSYLQTEILDYHTLDPAGLAVFEQALLLHRSESELDPAQHGSYTSRTDCAYPIEPGSERLVINQPCVLDDFSGNSLSRSPEWTLTLSAEYDFFLGPFGTLTPRVQYYWQDETYFRPFQRDFDLQQDFHKTDAKLIWLSPSERWNAEVFVSNIEDEAVIENLLISSRIFGSPPQAWYGEPRFYGVRLGFRY